MSSTVILADDARARLLAGMDLVANAVRPTLGPSGRNVAVDGRSKGASRRYGPPQVNAQCQAIIRDLELPSRPENLGAALLRQAARRTDELVGDGTATTIILAHALIREGITQIAAGANAMLLRRGIEAAAQVASKAILRMAQPCLQGEVTRQVLASASHSDEIAEALLWAVEEVGPDGMLAVERSAETVGIMVEVAPGFQFDRGLLSPFFVSNPDEDVLTLEQPLVLLAEDPVTSVAELAQLLGMVRSAGRRSLLLVAPEVATDVLAMLLTNHRRGVLACAAVRPPSYGEGRQMMLDDLAAYTGATVLAQARGHRLRDTTLADLGSVAEAEMTLSTTTLYEGGGRPEAIRARMAELRERRQDVTDAYDAEQLDRRIAQLGGGLGHVQVGGATDSERDNRMELVENALTALRATVSEGIVAGGGVAYLAAADALSDPGVQVDADRDIALGWDAVRKALEAPLRQIAENAGQHGAVVVAEVRRQHRATGDRAIGYDARTGTYGNLHTSGIVDPCRTVRAALANAASCASMVLTTEAVVLAPTPPMSAESQAAARRHLEMMDGRF